MPSSFSPCVAGEYSEKGDLPGTRGRMLMDVLRLVRFKVNTESQLICLICGRRPDVTLGDGNKFPSQLSGEGDGGQMPGCFEYKNRILYQWKLLIF